LSENKIVLSHLGVAEILARLALAAGLGRAIGIERGLRDRFAVAADPELERDSRIVDVVDGLPRLAGVTGAQWVH
jgi:hypothetical protein